MRKALAGMLFVLLTFVSPGCAYMPRCISFGGLEYIIKNLKIGRYIEKTAVSAYAVINYFNKGDKNVHLKLTCYWQTNDGVYETEKHDVIIGPCSDFTIRKKVMTPVSRGLKWACDHEGIFPKE